MNFKSKLGKLVTNINNGYKHNIFKIRNEYNKDLEKILVMLIKQGIIFCYTINYLEKKFIVYLKPARLRNTKKRVLITKSKVTLPQYISEYNLNSLKYKNTKRLLITSTNEGIIVNESQKVKGGELILEIV